MDLVLLSLQKYLVNGNMYDFPVDYNSIDKFDIIKNSEIFNKLMVSLIKQMVIVLLSFTSSLATKFVSLNDEPCMVRPTVIGLNPVELKYYPLMISLDKCNGSCNVLSPDLCVLKETKDKC